MADEIDVANEYAEKMIAQSLLTINTALEVEGTGFCLHCAEPVEGKRWCSADCRDDWEKENGNK